MSWVTPPVTPKRSQKPRPRSRPRLALEEPPPPPPWTRPQLSQKDYGFAVGGPRRPLWLGTEEGNAADGRPDIPYRPFTPKAFTSLSLANGPPPQGARLATPPVARALTVGSKLSASTSFSSFVREESSTHSLAKPQTPAAVVAGAAHSLARSQSARYVRSDASLASSLSGFHSRRAVNAGQVADCDYMPSYPYGRPVTPRCATRLLLNLTCAKFRCISLTMFCGAGVRCAGARAGSTGPQTTGCRCRPVARGFPSPPAAPARDSAASGFGAWRE